MIERHTMKNQNRTPPIIVHNAPKEKQALLNEFEQTQRIRLPVSLRHALMTLNYKRPRQYVGFCEQAYRYA